MKECVTWLVACLVESLRDCMHAFDCACIVRVVSFLHKTD
jgi:hypothetical protein